MIQQYSKMSSDDCNFGSGGLGYTLCQFPLNILRIECNRSVDSYHEGQGVEVYFYCNNDIVDVVVTEDMYDYTILRELRLL